MMSPQPTKAQLRRILLKKRQALPQSVWREKSDRICQHLQSFPLFQEAKTILAYLSIRQEPDLTSLFTANRQWGFCRCLGQSLAWHAWQPGDKLKAGAYGILEPDPDAPSLSPNEVDLILVPAIACDYQGYRLGYGGGFYDRLLNTPQWANIPTIGIIFNFAYLPQLPTDPWDKPLHQICTEVRNRFNFKIQ